MIYEIAVTKVPTVIEAQAGGQESLVLPITTVVASNPNNAMLLVGAAQAEVLAAAKGTADQWQVKIRQM